MDSASDRRAISIAGTQTGRAPRSVRRAASFKAYWRGDVNIIRRLDRGRESDPGPCMHMQHSAVSRYTVLIDPLFHHQCSCISFCELLPLRGLTVQQISVKDSIRLDTFAAPSSIASPPSLPFSTTVHIIPSYSTDFALKYLESNIALPHKTKCFTVSRRSKSQILIRISQYAVCKFLLLRVRHMNDLLIGSLRACLDWIDLESAPVGALSHQSFNILCRSWTAPNSNLVYRDFMH